MSIIIPRNLLAAVSQCMAEADIRYYLNGVFLELGAKEARLVATDGNVMAIARFSAEGHTSKSVIIPADAIKAAIKMKTEAIALEQEGDTHIMGNYVFKPVEGVFPDYRRAVPTTLSGQAGGFNPELLVKFSKAGKAMGIKSSPILRQNGEKDSALVHFYGVDDFVGIIMPLVHFNTKNPDLGYPTWARS